MEFIILNDQFRVKDNKITEFSSDLLLIEDKSEKDGDVLIINRTFTNKSTEAITFLPSLSVKTDNLIDEWFMPCVNYSGNNFGDGMDPKGFLYKGEPWIIPSDHMGIPGCTAVMGENGCSVLFLPPDAVKSAASLELDFEAVIQRVFFTHI